MMNNPKPPMPNTPSAPSYPESGVKPAVSSSPRPGVTNQPAGPTSGGGRPTGEQAGGPVEQAKHAAQALLGQTKEQVDSALSERKEKVVERASGLAGALRDAGEKLRADESGALPDYASKAADQVDRLTNYVRSRNVGELIADVESFARREPLIFLGGSFALGLAAARFLKSSADREPITRPGLGGSDTDVGRP